MRMKDGMETVVGHVYSARPNTTENVRLADLLPEYAVLITSATELMDILIKLVDFVREVEDEYANDGDGYIDTWQSGELNALIELADIAINKVRK